jgi:hypothetical protein
MSGRAIPRRTQPRRADARLPICDRGSKFVGRIARASRVARVETRSRERRVI